MYYTPSSYSPSAFFFPFSLLNLFTTYLSSRSLAARSTPSSPRHQDNRHYNEEAVKDKELEDMNREIFGNDRSNDEHFQETESIRMHSSLLRVILNKCDGWQKLAYQQ